MVDNKDQIRVLVVEDHNLSAHIARRFLTSLGCQVDCVSTGMVALDHFKSDKPLYHLILMDVSLPDPDMNGCTLAEKIREVLSNRKPLCKEPVPIVALTARSSQEDRERCLSAGMSEMLVKPLLKTTAREILETYVPKWKAIYANNQVESAIITAHDIEGDPINFRYALTIHNEDIEFIKSALQMVLDDLVVELKQLYRECMAQHWEAARVIIHKLEGGTRYFGLERLDQVCCRLSKVFQNRPKNQWTSLYHLLVSEVEKVRHAYEEWLKDTSIAE